MFCSLTPPASNAHLSAILASVACIAVPYLPTFSHKWHDFREEKNFAEHKICVLICSEVLFENVLIVRRNE